MREPRRPTVFLDRDGVVVRTEVRAGKAYAVWRLEDLDILPGVPAAVEALVQAGWLVMLVTNQPDVGAGKVERSVVEAMNETLRRSLPLTDIRVCYHTREDGCSCRKPKPGMLLDLAQAWGIDLERSVMVGDRFGDIDAGKAAGCRTILVDCAYDEPMGAEPDFRVASLSEAADLILATFDIHKEPS